MANKKGFRICSNDKEDNSSDVGSIRDGTDCSECSSSTSYKRKGKETSKKYSVNTKNVRKLNAFPQPQDTFKNLNNSPPHALTELPLSNKEATKNRINIPKKSISCHRAKKKIVSNKRTVSVSHKVDPHSQEVGSKTQFSKSHSKSNKQDVTRCISLTDIRNKKKGESVLSSLPLEDIFPLTPSLSEDFEKTLKSNGQGDYFDYFDYIKESDLIRNGSLLNQWGKSLWSSQKGALISATKLSSSKPFKLKKKTYSCGILSINDPEVPSPKDDKSDVKEDLNKTLKYDTDESEVCYLSENSDCEHSSGSEASGNKNVVETSSSHLNVKQPIRVKYIDENTAQNKELLFYSNDFLESIYKDKGRCKSNTEVFENVLEQSTIYEGNQLRVIPDIKEFFRNLKKNDRHQESTKKAPVSKHDAHETSKKEVIQSESKVKSTPCWGKNCFKAEMKNKRKDTVLPVDNFVKVKSQKSSQKRNVNDADSLKTCKTKNCFSLTDIKLIRSELKEFKDIDIKVGDDKSEIGSSKSRTALKRINTEEIIASNFRNYFHFYATLGGRLKSGVVISKRNSHFWLKKSGIIFDYQSFVMADDCFNAVARKKIVLNISDYLQYLSAIARRQRLFISDVVKRLTNINLQTVTKLPSDLESSQVASELQSTSNSQTSTQQWKTNNDVVKPPQKKI